MTDEINDGTFEPVGPANEDVAAPVKNFMLFTEEPIKVGDLIHTKRNGYFKVVEGGFGGYQFVERIEEDEAETGDQQVTYLEVYGIQVR